MRFLTVILTLSALLGTAYCDVPEDEYEPNDTLSTAALVEPFVSGSIIYCTLAWMDEDWFEISYTGSEMETIETADGSGLPYVNDTILELYESGTELIVAASDDIDGPGGNLYSAVTLTPVMGAGFFYLRVIGGYPNQPGGTYRLERYYGIVAVEDGTWGQVKALYR